MAYRVELNRQSARAFDRLMKGDPAIGARVAKAIDRIALEPAIGIPLKGKLKGLHKYRVGQYRIIYEIRRSHLLVIVIDIAHRMDVYR